MKKVFEWEEVEKLGEQLLVAMVANAPRPLRTKGVEEEDDVIDAWVSDLVETSYDLAVGFYTQRTRRIGRKAGEMDADR